MYLVTLRFSQRGEDPDPGILRTAFQQVAAAGKPIEHVVVRVESDAAHVGLFLLARSQENARDIAELMGLLIGLSLHHKWRYLDST